MTSQKAIQKGTNYNSQYVNLKSLTPNFAISMSDKRDFSKNAETQAIN